MSDTRRTPPLPGTGIDAIEGESTEHAQGEVRLPPEEIVLVARLRMGDERAFAALMDRYQGALLRLAQLFVSSRAVAEEVVQETWVGVVEGLENFESRSSLKTWIFRILTNRAKTRGVREGRSVPFSALAEPGEASESAVEPGRFEPSGVWAAPPSRWDDENPERLMMRQEMLRFVEGAIEKLPPSQRVVVTLRDVDGLDSAEVCNVLQISETNQRVLLHRARSKLRCEIEKHLGGAHVEL